jgi:endoglucanase
MPHGPADQPKSAAAVNVYWRRRVIALVAGLGMLSLVTWTLNGALGSGRTGQTTDLSQTTGHHSARPALGSGSTTPGTGPSSPGPSRAASGAAGATPSPSGKPTPTPSSPAAHHAVPAGACAAANLVLSLTSARYSYPAHVRPQFDVSVVSTARGRCTAALGAAHLHVRIRTGGKTRVWDSADCARPAAAARVTRLARGVPVVVQFSWNRTTSAPGCRLPHRAVRPGTYTATAYTGNRSSRAMVFVLKGRGIAVR